MTLVIDRRATPVRVLWAQMLPVNLPDAREALREREDINVKNWSPRIGSWQRGEAAPAGIPDLPIWADANMGRSVVQ